MKKFGVNLENYIVPLVGGLADSVTGGGPIRIMEDSVSIDKAL